MPRAIRLPILSAFIAVVFSLGCAESTSDPDAFRVALLTPGSISDGGWNAGAYEGLTAIRDQLGATISHVETRTPAAFEESFRDYAARDFDLAFGHGFEYQDAAAKVGAEFPETVFVTTSGSTVRENVAPMVFELEQATYLAGIIAGRMSQEGKIGLVGGLDLPSIRSTFIAFEAGVKSVRPDAEIREVFIGSFDDTTAAKEATLALLEEDVDFVLHQANEAGRGVFQALEEKSIDARPLYAFGTNRNQNAMAPGVVIASATLDIPGALVEVARRVKAGEFEAQPIRLGMNEGIVALEIDPELSQRFPEGLAAELDGLSKDIREDRLTVPRGNF